MTVLPTEAWHLCTINIKGKKSWKNFHWYYKSFALFSHIIIILTIEKDERYPCQKSLPGKTKIHDIPAKDNNMPYPRHKSQK